MIQPARSPLPTADALSARLADLLGQPVTILDREPNRNASIFLSEVITCRLADNHQLRLLCKSEIGSKAGVPSHAGRVRYEALVYREILHPSHASVPHCWGTFHDDANESWLVMEYLDGCTDVRSAPDQSQAFATASRWIGRFHALPWLDSPAQAPSFLEHLDAMHYRACLSRAKQSAASLSAELTWLTSACDFFQLTVVDLLLAQRPTVIHGDYFADNILHRDGAVFPIDWEWAAVGPGEIDLVCLTENWPAELTEKCWQEYSRARWPGRGPEDCGRLLDTVRLYLCFKYLPKTLQHADDRKRLKRLAMIKSLSEQLGLL